MQMQSFMKESIIQIRNKIISVGYRHITKPILFQQDPEEVHERFIKGGKFLGKYTASREITKLFFGYENRKLEQTIAGIHFKNPVGLAAGFDKNAELVNILPSVGFGCIEVGSITGEPCAGNPKPRLWRLPNAKAIIVYYGLKNNGAEVIAAKLQNKKFQIPLGISAAKTNCKETVDVNAGIRDYCKVLDLFKNIGAYYTINISCPNSFGGLDFRDPARLERLFDEMKKRKLFYKPIFLKISPDLTQKEVDALITLALKYKITGMICSNLIKKKENAKITEQEKQQWGCGGISGKPIKELAVKQCRYIFKKTKGKLIVIGCGGIFSGEDAYEYIKNGASLVQLITGMIYEGPQLISQINQDLVQLLKKDSFQNISEAIGKDVK